MSNVKHMPRVLEIIRTAAADCQAQGNTMAANELLEAASVTANLLETLRVAVASFEARCAFGDADFCEAAIRRATNQQEAAS